MKNNVNFVLCLFVAFLILSLLRFIPIWRYFRTGNASRSIWYRESFLWYLHKIMSETSHNCIRVYFLSFASGRYVKFSKGSTIVDSISVMSSICCTSKKLIIFNWIIQSPDRVQIVRKYITLWKVHKAMKNTFQK